MKSIGAVLNDLENGGLRGNLQQAARLAKIQNAVLRILREAGFDEITCRADGGEEELCLVVNPAAASILRQMRGDILARLQKEFPAVKRLRFGIQP